MTIFTALFWLMQAAGPVILENQYVKVSRNAAPCATAHQAGCGDRFFVFQEKLSPGETRARHSHSQRVVVVLNQTRLQQWPEGGPEVFRNHVPDDVHFNQPVIHVVKTVGAKPLRNIVIEFKPELGDNPSPPADFH